jgi:hypothetical protein
LLGLVGILEEIGDSKGYNGEYILWPGSSYKKSSFDPMTMVIDYLVMTMKNCNFQVLKYMFPCYLWLSKGNVCMCNFIKHSRTE